MKKLAKTMIVIAIIDASWGSPIARHIGRKIKKIFKKEIDPKIKNQKGMIYGEFVD